MRRTRFTPGRFKMLTCLPYRIAAMLGTSAAKALRRCCGNGPFPAAPSILDFDHCSKASAALLRKPPEFVQGQAVAPPPRVGAFGVPEARNDQRPGSAAPSLVNRRAEGPPAALTLRAAPP